MPKINMDLYELPILVRRRDGVETEIVSFQTQSPGGPRVYRGATCAWGRYTEEDNPRENEWRYMSDGRWSQDALHRFDIVQVLPGAKKKKKSPKKKEPTMAKTTKTSKPKAAPKTAKPKAVKTPEPATEAELAIRESRAKAHARILEILKLLEQDVEGLDGLILSARFRPGYRYLLLDGQHLDKAQRPSSGCGYVFAIDASNVDPDDAAAHPSVSTELTVGMVQRLAAKVNFNRSGFFG